MSNKTQATNQKNEIIERCRTANLSVTETTSKPRSTLEIQFPAGREKRSVQVNEYDFDELLKIKFEQCKFLSEYEAIWIPNEGIIEALVASSGLSPSIRRLRNALGLDAEEDEMPEEWEKRRIEVLGESDSGDPVVISLGPAKDEYAVFDNFRNLGGVYDDLTRRMTLRIEGIKSAHHDQAQKTLQKISDTFLFQVHQVTGIALYLSRSRELARTRGVGKAAKERRVLTFPTLEFDPEPMSMYWAGATSTMPLQRFFSYYQIVEHYFPAFAKKEAVRAVRSLLKDPVFSVHKDSDVGRLIGLVQAQTGPRGFGDERSQLKATLTECVTASELRLFLEAAPDRVDFYKKKDRFGVIAEQAISPSADDSALIGAVAERIYQIRCRIVHTKSVDQSDNGKALLPFSAETRCLVHDLQLMQYLARQVLISTSGPLHI